MWYLVCLSEYCHLSKAMAPDQQPIRQLHDRFFKAIFSAPAQAIGLIKGCLPKRLQQDLDWSSLMLDPNSYIDDRLKEYYSDLVFRCQFRGGEPVNVVFLLEHKSFVSTFPYLQLLRYMASIWEQQRHHGADKMVPVIPIILYHGKGTWDESPFESYFALPPDQQVEEYLPAFTYLLVNLKTTQDQEIQERFEDLVVSRGLLLMKYIFSPELIDHLEDVFEGLKNAVANQRDVEIVRIFIRYIYYFDNTKAKLVMQKVEELLSDWPYMEGSIADMLIKQGKAEGKA
ncbi:MAG: Rpn family recombination-promoting nuclease/putative transposase, partial [Bacteroidia bacterium]|nr:Rpn family recombination-promoting nuclease/putative transposase [Bacteroidia bacterium]